MECYFLGDRKILEDAGIRGKNDIEALTPPPEVKDNATAQKYSGDVSY